MTHFNIRQDHPCALLVLFECVFCVGVKAMAKGDFLKIKKYSVIPDAW
jgi:hypothetical protein